jgi:DNA-binding transcriptional MerR regulator
MRRMSSYSLADLCDLADVTPRTVRYYIVQGLLRAPSGGGPAARYDDGHLYRLRLIRQLQREHLPLAEIRRRLSALSDAEVEQLAVSPPEAVDTAREYVARVLGARGVDVTGRPRVTAASVPPAAPPSAPGHGSGALDDGSAPASPGLVRSQWERVPITPDIEIHVRRPLGRDQNRRIERLLETARALFQEDER